MSIKSVNLYFTQTDYVFTLNSRRIYEIFSANFYLIHICRKYSLFLRLYVLWYVYNRIDTVYVYL